MSKQDLAERLTEMLAAFDALLADLQAALQRFDAAIAGIKTHDRIIDGVPQVGITYANPDEDLHNHDHGISA